MTLVYRSPKQQLVKPTHELGPGSYDIGLKPNSKNVNHTKSCVFASSSNRDPFDIRKHEKELQEIKNLKGKKKQPEQQESTTSQLQNISSIVKPKKFIDCSHVFNSKVQRFQNRNQQSQQKYDQSLLIEEFKKLLLNDMTTSSKGKLLKVKDKLQKQKEIESNYQVFPSIPNYSNSYGYRYDSETNKWVSNQNPKVMEMLLEKERLNHKANFSLGPGCYIYNPIKENLKQKKLKEQKNNRKSTDLMNSFTCPSIKPQTPIHNSIQEDLNKKKHRIKLLGQSPINKVQEIISKTQDSSSILHDPNLEGKNKKDVLLLNQMYKKFRQYIPIDERNSPSKFIEQIKQQKTSHQSKSQKLQDISNRHQYFLSKSQRFDIETKKSQKDKSLNTEVNQLTADQTFISSSLDNSSLVHKSHNCKEPYSLGEQRFKLNATKQNLGPGTYNCESMPQTKLPPCLNLKDERFDQKGNRSKSPGPGEYNVSQEMLKRQNRLSDAYAYYKKMKNAEIQKQFKRQDSMQSLYQTWGRQMNYMVKMENQSRPQEKEEEQKKLKLNQNEQKSLIQTKKQLEESLKQFSNPSNTSYGKEMNKFTNERIISTVDMRSISEITEPKNPSKIYPKITKHLYEYKELPPNHKDQLMGPGKYETQRNLVKKTFNVTYT